jgi:hypothetical protein
MEQEEIVARIDGLREELSNYVAVSQYMGECCPTLGEVLSEEIVTNGEGVPQKRQPCFMSGIAVGIVGLWAFQFLCKKRRG